MLCSEKDASEKWCPHVRLLAAASGASFNRTPHVAPEVMSSGRCIGSRCMNWCWWSPPPSVDANVADRLGYCGLTTHPGVAE